MTVDRNFQEKWDPVGQSFWTDYSDWLFNKFVMKNTNPVLREVLREKISKKLKIEKARTNEIEMMSID